MATWSVPDGGVVSAAAANNAGQVLVALGGGALVYIECTSTNELKQQVYLITPICVDLCTSLTYMCVRVGDKID